MQFTDHRSQFSVFRIKTDNRQPTTDNRRRWRLGFSLIELLVVIAIISILIVAGSVYYTKSQQKVRDAKRKSDLKTVQVALDLYYAQNGGYPKTYLSGNAYKIQCHPTTPQVILEWGNPFTCNSRTYLKELPLDPIQDVSGNNRYMYVSVNAACALDIISAYPQRYVLYAKLENTSDPDISTSPCPVPNGATGYNYFVREP